MPSQRQMMGFETPGDEKVPVTVRDWDAMRRAAWRTAKALEIIANNAAEALDRCQHTEGCPGAVSETEPCLSAVLTRPGCRDREARMSLLVILNAARQAAPVTVANRPNDEYFAPSREYYSEVFSTLAAAEIEIGELRAKLGDASPWRAKPLEVPSLVARAEPTPAEPPQKTNPLVTGLLIVATCGIYGIYLLARRSKP